GDLPAPPEQVDGEIGVFDESVVRIASGGQDGGAAKGASRAGNHIHDVQAGLGPTVEVETGDVLERLETGQQAAAVPALDVAGVRADLPIVEVRDDRRDEVVSQDGVSVEHHDDLAASHLDPMVEGGRFARLRLVQHSDAQVSGDAGGVVGRPVVDD